MAVSTLEVLINGDATGLNSALAKGAAATKSFSSSATGAISKTQVAMVGFGAVAAVAITKAVETTTEWASEVRALQRVTGQTAESASGLAAAGETLGINVKSLTTGFGLLAKNIVNSSANLEKYGVATKDATGNVLPFDEVLKNVQEKFATLPEGPEQAAFAMNVFGRSGKDLIPILSRGADGLAELEASAKDAGLIMSQDTLDASKELSISQRELGEAAKGAAVALGTSFLPVMKSATDILTNVVEVVQIIPKPLLAMGFAAGVALGSIVLLSKAFTGLLLAKTIAPLMIQMSIGLQAIGASNASASMESAAISLNKFGLAGVGLTQVIPLVAAVGFTFSVIKGQIDDASISVTDLGKSMRVTAQFAGFLKDKFDLAGSAFEARSLSGFVASLDGVKDNLQGLQDALQPTIDKLDGLGISENAFTTIGARATDIMEQQGIAVDGSAGSIATLSDKVSESVAFIEGQAEAFGKGKQSLESFMFQMKGVGLTTQEATRIGNAALDQYGRHITNTGKVVKNFADLTTKELHDWQDNFTSSVTEAFGTLGTKTKEIFDTTPKQLSKMFSNMLAQSARFAVDAKKLTNLKGATFGISESAMQRFLAFLGTQAPGKIDAFIRSSTTAQEKDIHEWLKHAAKIDYATGRVDRFTNSVNDVPTKHGTDFETNAKAAQHQVANLNESIKNLDTSVVFDIKLHTSAGSPWPNEALRDHLWKPMVAGGFKKIGDRWTLPLDVKVHAALDKANDLGIGAALSQTGPTPAELQARKDWFAAALEFAQSDVPRLPRGHTNISVNHHERRRQEVVLDRKRFTDAASYDIDYSRGF